LILFLYQAKNKPSIPDHQKLNQRIEIRTSSIWFFISKQKIEGANDRVLPGNAFNIKPGGKMTGCAPTRTKPEQKDCEPQNQYRQR
jgi:hypothetical protein